MIGLGRRKRTSKHFMHGWSVASHHFSGKKSIYELTKKGKIKKVVTPRGSKLDEKLKRRLYRSGGW